jgi:S1-C subfamily serine protease
MRERIASLPVRGHGPRGNPAARLVCAALLALAGAGPGRAAAPRDAQTILSAVVGVRAEVPPAARTAPALGTRRSGTGVVIDGHGLIVTTGYLILEADRVFVASVPGHTPEVPAEVLAYDHDSGLGLLRARETLPVSPMPLGDSDAPARGAALIAASHGGAAGVQPAVLLDRREFAGYWEYLLEDALFTAPPHPLFGGAALIDPDGALLGIGSLIVADAGRDGTPVPGNMFIPINRLKSILGALLATGRGPGPARPWLGIHSEDHDGRVVIRRVTNEGPAARAGVQAGTAIVAVAGIAVHDMADFYRKLWVAAAPGDAVTLSLLGLDGSRREVSVTAGDRHHWLNLRR